jgi:anti-sigma factor RsiW
VTEHAGGDRQAHQELQLLLGAYVLGGLDAADRLRLEEHLPHCQSCTEELSRFAAVPGLLRLAPTVDEPVPPPDSLSRLVAAARARRAAWRRRWLLAAAAVLIVLLGVVGGVLYAGRETGPEPTAVVYADPSGSRVVGDAVLDPKAWGTEVRLRLNYLPRGQQPLTAWAVARNGQQEQAASWSTPPSGRCNVTGATSIQRADLDHIEVRSADGTVLLRTR